MSGAVAMASPDDDVPRVRCPKCGAEVLDFDGFGFVACPECEFCTHPSSTADASGDFVCNVCRKVTGRVTYPRPAAEHHEGAD
jgi:hypothetical protein